MRNPHLRLRFKDFSYDESGTRIVRRHRGYLTHLERLRPRPDDHLLRFFGRDFFHDGPIQGLQFSADARTLSWRIMATWITPKDESSPEHRAPRWSWFHCKFEDVVWFAITTERYDVTNDPLAWRMPLEYRYSEIDTLKPELAFYRSSYRSYLRRSSRHLHSLLIELIPPAGMLGLIFSRVTVLPEEPLAWTALLAAGTHDLGLYDVHESSRRFQHKLKLPLTAGSRKRPNPPVPADAGQKRRRG